MARVELALPDKFIFQTTLQVRVSDLNYGGHVGNDNILTLMQEARTLFYRSLGFESEIKLEGSISQVIADAVVIYKAEALLGDTLKIEIAVGELNKYGFDLFYRITSQHNKEVARGKTGVVCFDYSKRKVASVPQKLAQQLHVAV
ncbi:MAG: thioesterase family protein [Cyclobacteriaceae bacterium]|nr:thioesterase family protein [Cyclobacteriaceae bacterium]